MATSIVKDFLSAFSLSDYLIIAGAFVLMVVLWIIVKLRNLHNTKQKTITQSKVSHKKVKIKKEKIEIPDTKYKDYNALRTNKKILNFRYWKDLMLDKKHPDKTLLINMEMTNGFHRTFLIKQMDNSFKYNGKTYIIDNQLKYYNLDSKLYQLDYHENLTIPAKRNIDVEYILNTLKSRNQIPGKNIIPIEATNPALIEKFVQSKLLESLMKGGQFIESLKKFGFYLILILAISAIHFFVFIYASGMLQNLNVPGIG